MRGAPRVFTELDKIRPQDVRIRLFQEGPQVNGFPQRGEGFKPPGQWHCGHWRDGDGPCCGCGKPSQVAFNPQESCPGGMPVDGPGVKQKGRPHS